MLFKSFSIGFLIICFLGAEAFPQSKVKIGMSLDDFTKIYTGLEQQRYENSLTLLRPENLFGLEEKWGYRFEKGKLDWIYFNKYQDEISEDNFDQCLAATREIISAYTLTYGKPDTLISGDTLFRDPYQKRHWGYDVIEARWKNVNGMKIKVEFTFFGGKGEYSLLVKINYFDKNHPYYD